MLTNKLLFFGTIFQPLIPYPRHIHCHAAHGEATHHRSLRETSEVLVTIVQRVRGQVPVASQRDRQKGELFVHGYTLALTSLCCYYRPISELDNQNGYADVFLRPRCEIYKDMEHSYIIELKYLKSQTTEAEVKAAVKQAEAQLCRYADTVNVNDNIGHTTLHKVYVVYSGVEMVACNAILP